MTNQPSKPDWPPPDLSITAAEIAEVMAAIVIEQLLDQAKTDSG